MSHKNVSNKAVVKDSAFLAKLGSTMARRGPNPMEQGPVRSQVAWKKTSNVKYRLKTLTGTIPIYDDMTEEQVEDVKRKHGLLPGTFPEGIPPPPPGEEGGEPMDQEPDYEVMEATSSSKFMSTSSTTVHKQSSSSVTRVESSSFSHQEQGEHMESYTSSSSSRTRKKVSSSTKATEHLASTQKEARTSYVALEEYTPDDYDGLSLTPGQKVFLLSQSSPNKKARLEVSDDFSTGEAPQLLDNSLSKQKAAIRPKKNHPSSRARGHGGPSPQKSPEPQQAKDTSPTSQEERWLVQDFDTGREGYVPAKFLEISKQAAVVSSIKRSVAELSGTEATDMKLQMLAQIREFRSKRPQRTLGPTPEDEARAKRTGEALLMLFLAFVLMYWLTASIKEAFSDYISYFSN